MLLISLLTTTLIFSCYMAYLDAIPGSFKIYGNTKWNQTITSPNLVYIRYREKIGIQYDEFIPLTILNFWTAILIDYITFLVMFIAELSNKEKHKKLSAYFTSFFLIKAFAFVIGYIFKSSHSVLTSVKPFSILSENIYFSEYINGVPFYYTFYEIYSKGFLIVIVIILFIGDKN